MKRTNYFLALFLVLTLALVACGDNTVAPTSAPAPAATTAASGAATTAASGAATTAAAAGAATTAAAGAATTAAGTATTAAAGAATTAASGAATTAAAGTATTAAAGAATTAASTGAAPALSLPKLDGKTATILSLWGGAEQDAFQKVLDDFNSRTGAKLTFESVRDFVPTIRTRLASGNPPDMAIIPRPGVMNDLVKDGALKSLTDMGLKTEALNAGYSKAWQDLGTVNGKLYGLIAKANSKSTVWYKPASLKTLGAEVPKTWDELVALSDKYVAAGKKPWAIGGGDSWTLTDWFENIYLRQAGLQMYNDLFVTGKVKFTDPSVVTALKSMTQIVSNEKYIPGGRQSALGTKFTDGIALVYGTKPTAEMYFEGGFVSGIALKDTNPNLKPVTDIDFFPFPSFKADTAQALVGGGDLLVAFKDNDVAKAFVQYMASKEANDIWARTGNIVSPNKLVDASLYPNDLNRKEAAQLVGAQVFGFDGSDQMPGTTADDWGAALQDVLSKPENIDTILKNFDSKAAKDYNR